MPAFEKKKEAFSYDILREGEDVILRIDCEAYTRVPSLEDDETSMSKTIDILSEASGVNKIIFIQKRDYEYDTFQAETLAEIARIYKMLVKQKIINYYSITDPAKYAELQNILFSLLKKDPLGAYVEIRRILRREKIFLTRTQNPTLIASIKKIISLLEYVSKLLDGTKLIKLMGKQLAGYKLGDRSLYSKVFSPAVKPDFIFTRLMAAYPKEGEELDAYLVGNTEVTIFNMPDDIQPLYHIIPPEFKLSEDKYEIIDAARRIMSEHKPKK
ncbi:MAG: hypothetical protein QGH19_00985, partial [Candidatus Woesearchaeota archaeon]|nr:hypothetical protein [Candidatus Woesearchaeota archaeon]